MQASGETLFATDLSGAARLVLQALLWHRNRKTGQCNPRHETLARELGFCRRTICSAVAELRIKNRVSTRKTQRGCLYEMRENCTAETDPAVQSVRRTLRENCTAEPPASLYEPLELNVSGKPAAADACSGVVSAAASAPPPAALKPENTPNTPAPEVVAHRASPPSSAVLHDTDVLELHGELVAVHPSPGQPDRALSALETVLEASGDRPATLATIRAHHALWREYWATLPRERFIPQLWRWFDAGEWRIPPVIRKEPERSAWAERILAYVG